jgi:hypothetical protein
MAVIGTPRAYDNPVTSMSEMTTNTTIRRTSRRPHPRLSAATRIRGSPFARGINHLDLLNRPEVYAQIKQWLG